MKPLLILLVTFAISLCIFRVKSSKVPYAFVARIAMSCMLLFTGMGHFLFSQGMATMIPDILPFRELLIIGTGVFEIVLALALILPNFYRPAAGILIVFFIGILPANIYAALNNVNYQTGNFDGPGPEYLWFRIPLQLFFILWVYFSSRSKPLLDFDYVNRPDNVLPK